MRTLASTLALSILLLSAGAFASNDRSPAPAPTIERITVVFKNGPTPVIRSPLASCKVNRCIDI